MLRREETMSRSRLEIEGFNSGTLLSPAFMKRHVIPRHERIADACQEHGG